MAHGRSLLEEMAVSMKLGEAKRLTNHKRMIAADSISCIELAPVDPNAMIKLREVPIDMNLAEIWTEQVGRRPSYEVHRPGAP